MTNWATILGWGSPIGLGIFVCLIALMVFIFAKADEVSKRARQRKEDRRDN